MPSSSPLKQRLAFHLALLYARLTKRRLSSGAGSGTPKHILVAVPTLLGDLIMAQPAIAMLRHHYASARLSLLVRPELVELCEAYFPCDFVLPWKKTAANFFGLRRHVVAEQIDLCVIMIDNKMVPIIQALDVPRIVAYQDPKGRHQGTADVSFEPVPYPDKNHSLIDLFLHLAYFAAGCKREDQHHPQPSLPAANRPNTANAFKSAYAVIHPGAGKATRFWHKGGYIAAAEYLAGQKLHLVFTGSQSEAALCAAIIAELPAGSATSIAGKTSILELADLLAHARLTLGPDTGVLHLAKALGCPTVSLMGPSQIETFGYPGWKNNGTCLYIDHLDCRDKHDLFGHPFPGVATCSRNQCVHPDTPCMSKIAVETVLDQLAIRIN